MDQNDGLYKKSDELTVNLEDGQYTIFISDNANKNHVDRFEVTVRSGSSVEKLYAFDYGADYCVSPGAYIKLLDNMGNEVSEYNAVAYNGDDSYPIEESIISLPQNNYYEVALSQKDEDLGVTYYFTFSLRVKDGAQDKLEIKTNFDSSYGDIDESKDVFQEEDSRDKGEKQDHKLQLVDFLGKSLSKVFDQFGRNYEVFSGEGGYTVYYPEHGVGFGVPAKEANYNQYSNKVSEDASISIVNAYEGNYPLYGDLNCSMTYEQIREFMKSERILIDEPYYDSKFQSYMTAFWNYENIYHFVVEWSEDPYTQYPTRIYIKTGL